MYAQCFAEDSMKENIMLHATRQICVNKVYVRETFVHVVAYVEFIEVVFIHN